MIGWATDRIDDWRDSTWGERVLFLGIALVIVFIVLGIGAAVHNSRDVSGTVVDKEFTAAHYVTETQCAPNVGKSGCSVVVTQRYVGDSWEVTVRPDDGSSNVSRSVSESYWNQVNIGDRWVDSASG